MLELWMLLALVLPSPLLFVAGFVVGNGHVRYLAKHGGESGYPDIVQETARKYRQQLETTEVDRHD